MYFNDATPNKEGLLKNSNEHSESLSPMFFSKDEEFSYFKALGVLPLVSLMPILAALFRNSYLLLNAYYAAQVDLILLQKIGVGFMIVGLLYTSTGLAFNGALDSIIRDHAISKDFTTCKILKRR